MHHWCPFTNPAEHLWREAAEAAGVELRIVMAGSDEGASVIAAHAVRGVPCVLVSEEKRHYGMLSPDEARAFLKP